MLGHAERARDGLARATAAAAAGLAAAAAHTAGLHAAQVAGTCSAGLRATLAMNAEAAEGAKRLQNVHARQRARQLAKGRNLRVWVRAAARCTAAARQRAKAQGLPGFHAAQRARLKRQLLQAHAGSSDATAAVVALQLESAEFQAQLGQATQMSAQLKVELDDARLAAANAAAALAAAERKFEHAFVH